MCVVDLLDVGLEEATCDAAAKHDGEITDSGKKGLCVKCGLVVVVVQIIPGAGLLSGMWLRCRLRLES